ncbi:MAG: DNA mismatch repair endonuclease MutL, partial [Lachnospiraceae bacterium]|nr:DNA mismatch repair endonuclease MutL [Lachnospiraceae bacterium]
GTTILVKNLFYNTPPRRKFLKQPQTEGSYVADLMEHLALSNPKVSFKYIMNGQTRFYTTGNGELQEIIYRIYGRDIAAQLLPFAWQGEGIAVSGFLGKPVINRANRNYEIFYINGRYIKSNLISRSIEEGYREYLMQHKFPFCVLHFQIDTGRIDVNVHPTKMEVRIADGQAFYETVKQAIHEALHDREMIPEISLTQTKEKAGKQTVKESIPEPFEKNRIAGIPRSSGSAAINRIYQENRPGAAAAANKADYSDILSAGQGMQAVHAPEEYQASPGGKHSVQGQKPVQMELFDDRILSEQARPQFELIGQIFDTYWLISYQDKLLIIDQHAAHEKVKYERFMKHFQEHNILSQTINPPIVVTLSGRERECYIRHADDFEALGFMIEEFGGSDYAIRGVPLDLYGYGEKDFFQEILDELALEAVTGTPEGIRIRIATMACKAAVKGNMRLSRQEAEQLIDELLTLDNPYHCPHGRPTVISMSKYELEKKFKRIVN